MTSGAGIAGSSGQMDYRELVETTATKENAMKTLKLLADTLEMCMLIFDDPQLLRYSSSSNRPVLSPLISTRVATSSEPAIDESWKSIYENLVNLMPQDFRELFQAIMLLPKGQQSRDFVLLNNALQTEARILAFLAKAALPIESGSLADIRATENTVLPYIALKFSLADSVMLFNQVQLFLEAVGPNHANFDAISNYVGAFAPLVNDLRDAFELLNDPATEKEGRAQLSDLGYKLDNLAEIFDRLFGGNELLFLGNSFHATALLAKALSLEQPGAAPLLISLTIANLGMESDKSDIGFFGKGLGALSNAFASGVGFVGQGKISSGGEALLNELATTAFIGMLIFGSLNYNTIAANDKKESSPEVRSENNFSYGLLLDMLTDSKGLSTLSSLMVNAAGIEGSAKDNTQALLLPMLLFFLLSASISGTDLTSTEPLVRSQSSAIEGSVQNTSTLVENAISEGTLTGEDAANFNVYLKQASIALEQGDIGAFIGALNACLELTGATTDDLIADRKELNNVSQTLQNGVNTSASEQASYSTGVHVAA